MLATVRTTVLPEFSVTVYPAAPDEHDPHQRYVLVLRDGTNGSLELWFPSAQDLRVFLSWTRQSFALARQEVKARKARPQPPAPAPNQLTFF